MRKWLVAVVLLVGCATPYQPVGVRGGYSERQVNERSYEVSFEGNGYTTKEAARRMAVRRAAELALHRGFAGFAISGSSVSSELQVLPTGPNDPVLTDKPQASLVIILLSADELRANPGAYDARMVMAQAQ